MNLFSLHGSDFLVFYLVLLVVAIAAAVNMHRRLRHRSGPVAQQDPTLNPYEIAILNKGGHLAIYTALAALCSAGALAVNRSSKTISIAGDLPPGANAIEKELYLQIARRRTIGPAGTGYLTLLSLAEPRKRLEDLELIIGSGAETSIALKSCLPLAAVMILGMIRISTDFSPEGQIVMLLLPCTVVALIVLGILCSHSHRSTYGDALLARLLIDNSALRTAAHTGVGIEQPDDVATAVALYGLPVFRYGSGSLAELSKMLAPQAATSYRVTDISSSCGVSSGSSYCCGGGHSGGHGCGGHGCGGHGCGGGGH